MADINLDRLSIVQIVDFDEYTNHCMYCHFYNCGFCELKNNEFIVCPLTERWYFSKRNQKEIPLFCPCK